MITGLFRIQTGAKEGGAGDPRPDPEDPDGAVGWPDGD
jgi:hypothetical protein